MVPRLQDARKRVLHFLDQLCADPGNLVSIVSGHGKDQQPAWFAPSEKLGICAEHNHHD
jgi:trehalose 6-phosphate synthase/phosphatase